MNLMPPGGGKQPLQFNHQMKVKKGKFDNNGLNKMFTQCQLNVLIVVSYLFVSYFFPM